MIVIFVFIVLSILGLKFIDNLNKAEKDEVDNSCVSLGCSADTKYVGSKNSDKYYGCDCHYAKRVKPENIVCFKDDKEALDRGYEKSDC